MATIFIIKLEAVWHATNRLCCSQ